jgi:spore germination cell wall hydrolase CwlJ-like protein
MEKYIQKFVFSIIAVVSIGVVGLVTQSKLDGLHAQKISLPYDFANMRDRERQLKCMAQNIYWEAASEPAEGKIAVAQIVMNRIESGKFPKDPCQVIYQKNVVYEKVICQFSWYCEHGGTHRPPHQRLYDESYEAAKMVLLEGFRLPGLKDSLYYHADYVSPNWNKEKVTKIGRHIFYKDRDKRI